MTMHPFRKASVSNSNTLARYEIIKSRRTFSIVILVEKAKASYTPPV